jgi:hypothetical protein
MAFRSILDHEAVRLTAIGDLIDQLRAEIG